MGKTQTAIEYAYRYKQEYHTIAWVQAYSREVLETDMLALATLLQLPVQDDQSSTLKAVKQWFSTLTRWLLVFDNADDLSLLEDFLPSPAHGHILLTTRTRATGTLAQAVEIETMEPDEGAYFLLRRAKIISLSTSADAIPTQEKEMAIAISQALGGLPLALDQAGAYIEETACGLANYLKLYQEHREVFLRRRGTSSTEHPEPVATTWSLAFEKLRQGHPDAIELLHMLAFCAPDSLPEELCLRGAPDLGPTLASFGINTLHLNRVIAELRKYSLVSRNPESNTLTIHRLVQAVLQAELSPQMQRQWIERVVRATNTIFPSGDFETWQQCERLLPQALQCLEYIEQVHLILPEAARLLRRVGRYLQQRGQYGRIEHIYQMALAISEETLGTEHLETAKILNDQGELYFYLSKPQQAEPIFQRALAIRERLLPADHLDVVESIYNVGLISIDLGYYEQAEQRLQQALSIRQAVLGRSHAQVAESLRELGVLYFQQTRYAQAATLLEEALQLHENHLGENHLEVGPDRLNLAAVYREQGKYEQAEELYLKTLRLWEKTLDPEHPNFAYGFRGLAKLYAQQGKYTQAHSFYEQAIAIFEKAFGSEDARVLQLQKDVATLQPVQIPTHVAHY